MKFHLYNITIAKKKLPTIPPILKVKNLHGYHEHKHLTPVDDPDSLHQKPAHALPEHQIEKRGFGEKLKNSSYLHSHLLY